MLIYVFKKFKMQIYNCLNNEIFLINNIQEVNKYSILIQAITKHIQKWIKILEIKQKNNNQT